MLYKRCINTNTLGYVLWRYIILWLSITLDLVCCFVTLRFGEVNDAYRDAFGTKLPARTCVEVKSLLDPEAQVEIDVVACQGEHR